MTEDISVEEYQAFTLTTWDNEGTGIEGEMRCVLGVNEEAGEVAGKVKKWLRGDYKENAEQFRNEIQKELGDLLWYTAMLHNIYDMDMAETMTQNVTKLLDRKERGVIKGSGDER